MAACADVPESPEARAARSRRFRAAQELHRQRCSGVVIIALDVDGLPPWRPFTEGDLDRLSLGMHGSS